MLSVILMILIAWFVTMPLWLSICMTVVGALGMLELILRIIKDTKENIIKNEREELIDTLEIRVLKLENQLLELKNDYDIKIKL